MGKGFRSVSKTAIGSLALALALSSTPKPAMAQWQVTDPTWLAEAATQAGQLLSTLSTIFGGIDSDMQALSGTMTNNMVMQTSILAKGVDKHSSDAYVLNQQSEQSHIQQEGGAGNLAILNGNQCEIATSMAGSSSFHNAHLVIKAMFNPYRAASVSPLANTTGSLFQGVSGVSSGTPCTVCGTAVGNLADQDAQKSPTSRRHDLFTSAQQFAPGNGDSSLTDLDVDGDLAGSNPVFDTNTQTAYIQRVHYLLGEAPPPLPTASSFTGNTSLYEPAFLARKDDLAIYNMTAQPFHDEYAAHQPAFSGAAATDAAQFTSANLADPRVNGYVSEKAHEMAMYELPAENGQLAANLAGMMTSPQILRELTLRLATLTALEYKRYEVEQEAYKLQAVSLALQRKQTNFGAQ